MTESVEGETKVLAKPDLGAWRQGNTGVEGVWQFAADRPGKHLLVAALIHGNELCGAWALKDLLDSGVRPHAGTLTLAFCNLAAFDRFDPADVKGSRFVDEDLNRVWNDALIDAGGSLERQRAHALRPFVREADWLLDLHSMSEPSLPLILTGIEPRNVVFASVLGSRYAIVIDAGHKNGTRMRDYAQFGVAGDVSVHSLLVECGLHTDPACRGVARDILSRFLDRGGALDPERDRPIYEWQEPGVADPWILEVTEGVVAGSTGCVLARPYHGLEVISRAGTVIGKNGESDVTTPYDDCVLIMPTSRAVKEGLTAVRLARQRVL